MRAHVDAGQQAAQQEDGEACRIKTIGPNDSTQGPASRAQQKARATPVFLHDGGHRGGREHRPQNDQRNRQRGKTGVGRQGLPGQSADCENHRHLRANQGLREHKNKDRALGAFIIDCLYHMRMARSE